MADNDQGTVHGSSDGGVAGKHDPVDTPQLVVGPSTSDQFNAIVLRLAPVACFRVDDIRFAFDSSFVPGDPADEKNDIRAELRLLVDLLKDNPQAPLSVFGHADPVGTDDYNKKLSGRRATVIYALLICKSDPTTAVELWQGVAKQENWGTDQRQNMQTFTGLPAGTPDSDLFKAHMQKFYPADLSLTKKDFVAQGADPNGKGDYQGCSEFNPVLIFSTKRNNELESQSDKTARNDANSSNRRVMVLLFKKGTQVVPNDWPCPRATEGVSGCINRFWSDGDKRRSTRLPDTDRKIDDKKDLLHGTFACRFYQRLVTDKSPCESQLTIVKIRLFDPQARPLPFAPCLITETGKDPRPDRATGAPPSPAGTTPKSPPGSSSGGNPEDAVVTLRVQNLPATVNLKWSRPKEGEGAGAPLPEVFKDTLKDGNGFNYFNGYKYEFEMDVTIDIPDTNSQTASMQRLKNLGYVKFTNDADNIRAFQKDYKPKFADIVEDGTLNQATIDAIKATHDATNPVLKAGSDIELKR